MHVNIKKCRLDNFNRSTPEIRSNFETAVAVGPHVAEKASKAAVLIMSGRKKVEGIEADEEEEQDQYRRAGTSINDEISVECR